MSDPNAQPAVAVYFVGREWEPGHAPPGPAILIRPTAGSYNDFGRIYRTRALIIDARGEQRELEHRLMFAGETITAEVLNRIPGGMVEARSVKESYLSLFGDESSYAELVQLFGREPAISALEALRDLNAIGDSTRDDAVDDMARSEDFVLGVLRDADVYRAYRKGRRHLSVDRGPPIADAAQSFGGAFKVGVSPDPLEIAFDFEPDIFVRDRMAVIVGANGLGKSSILAGIVDAARSGHTSPDEDDRFDYLSPPPRFNKMLVIDSSGSARYPRRLDPGERLDYAYLTQSAPGDATIATTLALIDVLRDPERIFHGGAGQLVSRKALLKGALSRLGLWEDLHLPLMDTAPVIYGAKRVGGIYAVPVRALAGEKRSLQAFQHADAQREPFHAPAGSMRSLSSGELMFFRLAVLIAAAIEKGTLLLIDEPENHLHPHFVGELMALLDRVLKPSGSCAVIATHSPFVVREAPRRRVQVLHKEGGRVFAGRPRLQTFGASVEAISQAVFADGEAPRLHEELLDRWLEEHEFTATDLDQIVETYGDELNPETLSYIAERLKRPAGPAA